MIGRAVPERPAASRAEKPDGPAGQRSAGDLEGPSHELVLLTAALDAATASSGTLERSRTFRPCCTTVLSCFTTSTSNEAIACVGRDLLSRNSASVKFTKIVSPMKMGPTNR